MRRNLSIRKLFAMVSVVIVGIFVALCLYRCYKYCFYRPPNYPPGPPRLPLIGSYLFLLLINHKSLYLAMLKLCKYYKSNLIGFYFGPYRIVVANDQKTVREVLLNQEFDGRGDFLLGRLRDPNFDLRGIFNLDGDIWLHQRRFTLRNLRDFGFGRRHEDYEIELMDEMKGLMNLIKEGPKYEHERKYFKADGLVSLPKALIAALTNCFLQACVGQRLSREDQHRIFKAGEGSFGFVRNSNEYGNLFGLIPSYAQFFPELSFYKQCRESSMAIVELMKGFADKQLATYQEGHIRNFVDIYIKEIKDAEAKGEISDFTYDQLVMMISDFALPALSSTESQLTYLFRILSNKKRVLKKVQDEIESVVGSGRLPDLNDRINLPYCEATLREVLRFETIIQSGFPHRSVKDTTLLGYDIPKDTYLITNLHAMNNEKEVWKDPENFRPERFLDFKGRFSVKKDVSLPFSAGRRLCPGETFARNVMFLFMTGLLQNFDIKIAEKEFPNTWGEVCGTIRTPNDIWFKFETK